MSERRNREPATIGLHISRERNRSLLADLFGESDVLVLAETIPDGVDLCVVDERGFSAIRTELARWKREQQPCYAPVLLLSESSTVDPWQRYSSALGESIDVIKAIPAPKAAIRARVDSLLQTRELSLELASERRMTDRIFETSPIAKTILDADGNIVRANEHAEKVFGLSESEVEGRAYDSPEWEILDADGNPIPSDQLPFARVMATGEPVYGYEHGIERPGGERAWLSVNMAPLKGESGEIDFLVAAIDDITEQKRLERNLRESEALHRATLSNIRDTVVITDDAGQFTYVCPNTRHIFGYSPEEVSELGTVDALLGDDIVGEDELGANHSVENVERDVTDAEGNTHTVLVTVTPVDIQEGTRLYTVRDITERKRQEERFQAFIEHSSDIITVLNDEGVIEYQSPAITNVLGYDPEELVGESAFDYLHPADRDQVTNILRSGIEQPGGTTLREQYRFRHADGSWRWLESVATTHALPNGGHVINSRDITERIEAEQERRKMEESRTLALTAANAGIWEIDLDSGEMHVHESCERLFGLEPGSFDGTFGDFLDYVHPDDRTLVEQAFDHLLDGNESTSVTFRIIRSEGGERWIQARSTVHEDTAEDRTRLLGVGVDITDQQERIKHLRVLDDVLRHNLHNQMNIIRGYAETIRDMESGTVAKYADSIIDTSDRILTTTDKQRKITKILSTEPHPERLDIASIVRHIATDIRTTHPDVDVELDVPESAEAMATNYLAYAIEELVENAIRHNDRDRKAVTLRVERGEQSIIVQISDNGPGIPEMEQKVVTGERSIEPLYHGSGLGLWLVAWIVRRAVGTLHFDSAGDRGTTVTVRLPAAVTEGHTND